jgi:16S rRNA (cytosine967-C5)-methyltransferase
MPSARVLAIDALVRIEDGAYAQVLLPAMLRTSGLRDRDRAFATDLVYGTVREQRRLDDLLASAAKRPIRRLDAPVRAALRLGAYQLVHDVPRHAAVSETVDALGARSPRARGFVNAVLRALSCVGPPFPEPRDEAVALSYPDWLVARLDADLGAADARAALAAMNEPASVTLRARDPDALDAELRAAAVHVQRGELVPAALVVRGVGDPAALAAVRDGRATPQDQASQALGDVVDAQPGEIVADVAAAPGGKASALAERGARVVALDVDAGRLRLVTDGAARLHLADVHCVVADGRALPLRAARVDRVLLDAPCSGLGVLRRRPDARWRVTEDSIGALAALQRELLAAAAELVRPGGVLVYSVCTLTRAETVAVDEWAAEHLSGFDALPAPAAPWRPSGRGALILPQDAGTDGMFVLALRAPESTVTA